MKHYPYSKYVIILLSLVLGGYHISKASEYSFGSKIDTLSTSVPKNTKKHAQHRYYYDFKNKTVLKTETASPNGMGEPLKFKSGNDISIGIFNYNPLKYTISVGDSSASWFLSDTALVSKAIKLNLPAVSTTTAKTPSAQATVEQQQAAHEDNSQKFHGGKKSAPIPVKTDCDKMQDLIKQLTSEKSDITASISDYNLFLAKVEIINDCLTNLQNLSALTPDAVRNELDGYFVPALNDFLKANSMDQLNGTSDKVSVRDIAVVELKIYQLVMNKQKELDNFQKQADPLTGKDCSKDFVALLKQFTTNIQALKDQLTSFDSDHTQKNYLQFKKDMVVYQNIKNYLTEKPEFFSSNTPINNDEHFIKIYFATPDNPTKPVLYDKIHIVAVRGWKIDVSTGFFVSGLSDQAFTLKSKDSIFHTQYVAPGGKVHDTITNQSFTSINKQKQAGVSYGAMVYIHAHTQRYSNLNYGLSLGFGTMFNDQARWVGSLGPTFLIGKKQRFNISPSIMVGQVDRLSAPYQTGTWYKETIDNVPTFKAWQLSWGLGFSWNL